MKGIRNESTSKFDVDRRKEEEKEKEKEKENKIETQEGSTVSDALFGQWFSMPHYFLGKNN